MQGGASTSYNYIGLYNSTYRGYYHHPSVYQFFFGLLQGAPFNSIYFPIVAGRYPTRYPSRKSIGLSLTHPDTSVVVALACDRILGDFCSRRFLWEIKAVKNTTSLEIT